jgi:predicted MPP superfamily phosphohydrolase
MAQRPDLVLIAGDVFQGSDAEFERWLPELRRLFSKLDAPGGVFLVPGDVDQSPGRLERLVEHTRVRLLRNAVAQVVVNDRRITLAGLELDVWSDDAEARLGELQRSADAEDIRIVLSHRPDSVLRLDANSRVDLVVAGHTHGGQVCVPGFGPPMTLTRVPRYAAAGGLHDVGGNAVFVSRGVGCERGQAPRVRFFCPPEVAVVRLTSAKRADANHTLTSED